MPALMTMVARIVILLALLCATSGAKVKNVVVLMLENRPFDHIFGWAGESLKVNGLKGDEYNYVQLSNTSSEKVFVNGKCPFINDCDPGHGTTATTFKIFGGSNTANNGGFVSYEATSKDKNYCDVMSGFTPDRLPIINTLAAEFAVMDRFFASHPGPTWPNRMYTLSGTSAGSTETSVWYHNRVGQLFPQQTIFDQIEVAGLTWRNYYNDTPWELFMTKIAHSPENLKPMDSFYQDAAQGTLPSFSWINPRSGINVTTGVGSNDQHPDHDMNAGEQFIKDIYESLRISPQWNETLFIVTYDEHGGFYDHVIPPMVDIPEPGDNEPSYPEINFKFNRLGLRIPTLLISPWIPKGTVISEPPAAAKPTPSSEFDLTSIIASARLLLGMPNTPLTKRDAWSARFDYVLDSLKAPRDDCLVHLPSANEPEIPIIPEHQLPLNPLQVDIAHVHAIVANIPIAEYSTQGEHSEWVQDAFSAHLDRTEHWRSSKQSMYTNNGIVGQQQSASQYRTVAQTCPLFRSVKDESNWNVNGLKYGGNPKYAQQSQEPFVTISTKTLQVNVSRSKESKELSLLSVPLCLDANNGMEGALIHSTPCYPSEDPSHNRDQFQHFIMPGDGTIRYYDRKIKHTKDMLCVTNANPDMNNNDDSLNVYLRKCTSTVMQSWAYHGWAAGEGGDGRIEYGDIANCLGVVLLDNRA